MRGIRLIWGRAVLAWSVWARLGRILWLRRKFELPELVERLAHSQGRPRPPRHPIRQGRAVHRLLTLGPVQARCLTLSLIHFSLLADQGYRPNLVIGLPGETESHDAHAWVEIGEVDVGPPPGKGTIVELARFPRSGVDFEQPPAR